MKEAGQASHGQDQLDMKAQDREGWKTFVETSATWFE